MISNKCWKARAETYKPKYFSEFKFARFNKCWRALFSKSTIRDSSQNPRHSICVMTLLAPNLMHERFHDPKKADHSDCLTRNTRFCKISSETFKVVQSIFNTLALESHTSHIYASRAVNSAERVYLFHHLENSEDFASCVRVFFSQCGAGSTQEHRAGPRAAMRVRCDPDCANPGAVCKSRSSLPFRGSSFWSCPR